MPQGEGKDLEIKQFRYSSDNLGYLICSEKNAIAVDGGAVHDILDFIRKNNLDLKYVINTHSHGDHTSGNRQLLKDTDAQYVDYKTLTDKGIELDDRFVNAFKTPGHTPDSIIIRAGDNLITGDTLFIGKVGRCFSGDKKGFLDSINTIIEFPDDSIIYPGHDYVLEYMEFDRKFDVDKKYIDEVLDSYASGPVRSCLGLEKKINPFLMINSKRIISQLEKRGLPVKTEYDRWTSMISLM